MKLGLFTDSHYSSQKITCGKRYNSRSFEKIKEAYAVFQREHCDLVICLGDLTDLEDSHSGEIENLKEIAKAIQSAGIPTVCVMGNHDADVFTVEEFYEILGGCRPVSQSIEGKNLIFLDACYFENGNHYMPGQSDWTNTCLPQADVQWLKEKLCSLETDTYIFMHQNLDPTLPKEYRLANEEEIRQILEESGIVKAVIQGHYHAGKNTVWNGIPYITLPAMCEREEAYQVLEILS